ncbi:UNVERIFIED_CONTAM: hypothetical protein HHA_242100 [Hammondia hammondi]|eukprot:XP_008884437.1 hypothetical protein HHA_242100 [Hammondia hammondi]
MRLISRTYIPYRWSSRQRYQLKMKNRLLSPVGFFVVVAVLTGCRPPGRCVGHYGSSSNKESRWTDREIQMLATSVKPHAGFTDTGPRTSTQNMNDNGLLVTERSGAQPGFRTAEEQLSEGASVREDLTSGSRAVLTKKGARARTTKRHKLVAVTLGEHSWNQGIADHEEQTAAPVAASNSFMQNASSLGTPAVLNAPVDLQGRLAISSAVRNRPPPILQLSPREISAKNELDDRFAKGLQLKVESIFTGEASNLVGPAQFLGVGATAVVFSLSHVRADATRGPQRLAAKIGVRSLQPLRNVSSSERRKLVVEARERFLTEESAVRNLLQDVTPETALEHGVLFPTDVYRVSNLPSGFRLGNDYAILSLVSLSPAFACNLQMVFESGLSRAAKLHLTRQILTSVAWLHANGVAHNDLKLDNVFLCEEGKAVIGDCGFAAKIGTPSKLKYTATYLDPQTAEERLQEKSETIVAVARDAWALGTLIFVLWCTSYPFFSHDQAVLPARQLLEIVVTMAKTTRPTPSFQHCHELPSPVRDLIAGFLQWSPEARRLPRDVVDEFLAATVSEAATSSASV